MSDYIYNDFSDGPEGDGNQNGFNHSGSAAKKTNIALILVCALFGLLILLTTVFGIIIVNKISSSDSGDDPIISGYIYTSPTTTAPSDSQPVQNTSGGEYETVTDLVYSVKDSVVEIKTTFVVNNIPVSSSAGSGVIIGEYTEDDAHAGYFVITNAHVIQDSYGNVSDEIIIRTTSGTEYEVAQIRGIDSYGDLAILIVKTTDSLRGANFGDSNSLVLGQPVVAIGNPLGTLGGTVTTGIISALDREIEIDGNVFNLLQTNAAINPGNSGGALFNMKGEVIGIVNAKSAGEGIEGIGFAIPSNEAKSVASSIIKYGYAEGRPYIGVTAAVASSGLSTYVYVHELESGKNDSVLKKGDIIMSMNDKAISSLDDFRSVLSRCKPGDTINVKVRRNQDYLDLTIDVYERTN